MLDTAVDITSAERRVGQRQVVGCSAVARFEDREVACTVTELSVTGARVEILDDAILPERLRLSPAGLFDIEAEVCWRRGRNAGLRFVGDPSVNATLVIGLAVYGV